MNRKSTLCTMRRSSNVFSTVSISSNYKIQQANGTSFIQIIPSNGIVYLLPLHNCEHECRMAVEGFLKRSCCKGGRGGTNVGRWLYINALETDLEMMGLRGS